jgi:rod shape-determining protein MreC
MAAGYNRRYGQPESAGPKRTGARNGIGITLFAVAAAVMLVSRFEPNWTSGISGWTTATVAPVAAVMNVGLDPLRAAWRTTRSYLTGSRTASRLPVEVARTAALTVRIQDLERENRELKALTRFAPYPKSAFLSAQIIMSSGSPLSRTILIGAGSAQGIKTGHPVVADDGLIGRILQVDTQSASVLLLSDRLSRVPVLIGAQQARAVLVGDGQSAAKLDFIGQGAPIAVGDLVTTSGTGGLFPRGLTVGIVVADGGGWRVELTAGRDDPIIVGVQLAETSPLDSPAPVSGKAERSPAIAQSGPRPQAPTDPSPTSAKSLSALPAAPGAK